MTEDLHVPEPNPWPAVIGPCYVEESLRRELRVSGMGIIRAAQERRVLQIVTSDGVNVYPAFQVQEHQIVPGLGPVLRELETGSGNALMWAQWLNKPVKRSNGQTRRRIDELSAGHVEALVHEARHTAAAWLGDGSREVEMVTVRAALTLLVTSRDVKAVGDQP